MSPTTTLRPLADLTAVIDEARCIGCTLCIEACPVDAIVGAAKLMHTVISASCTGCELCVPPCPVDCIVIRSIAPRDAKSFADATAQAQRRFEGRNARLARQLVEKTSQVPHGRDEVALGRKQATIARALARARQRLAQAKMR